jgi:hypothetical protein
MQIRTTKTLSAAPGSEHLSAKSGDILLVVEGTAGGYWRCENSQGQIGTWPARFSEAMLGEETPPRGGSPPPSSQSDLYLMTPPPTPLAGCTSPFLPPSLPIAPVNRQGLLQSLEDIKVMMEGGEAEGREEEKEASPWSGVMGSGRQPRHAPPCLLTPTSSANDMLRELGVFPSPKLSAASPSLRPEKWRTSSPALSPSPLQLFTLGRKHLIPQDDWLRSQSEEVPDDNPGRRVPRSMKLLENIRFHSPDRQPVVSPGHPHKWQQRAASVAQYRKEIQRPQLSGVTKDLESLQLQLDEEERRERKRIMREYRRKRLEDKRATERLEGMYIHADLKPQIVGANEVVWSEGGM